MQSKLLAKSQTWLLANMESILHWNIFVTTSFELCAQLAIVFTEQNIELNFIFLKLNIALYFSSCCISQTKHCTPHAKHCVSQVASIPGRVYS